jgi:acid phosphatase family membrane protein YuiD
MTGILDVFENRVLLVAVCGWFSAQAIKVIIAFLLTRKFDISRLFFGTGGMPSSHSAFVCAAGMAVGFQAGFDSELFGIAACIAMVVMTDAAGVRRAAGKQAAVLNRIIDDMIHEGKGIDEEKLKELIGHTPVQVFAGALLGILIGVILG